MNRVYSKVWNASLGQLVVASELAKSRTKGGKTGTVRKITKAVAVSAFGAAIGLAGVATAADVDVQAGTNVTDVTHTTDNGTDVYTVNADGTTVSGVSGGDVVVTPGTKDGDNVTDYAVDLSQDTKNDIQAGVSAKNTVDNDGLTFTGNSGTTGKKKLGDTVAITGDSNITTEADSNGVQVKLNPDLEVDSVKASSLETTSTLTVGGSATVGGALSVTGKLSAHDGLDMDSSKITNVADGTNANDAVNKGQLDAVASTANAGWDISAQGANATNVASGDAVDLANSDGNIKVSKTTTDDDVNVNFDLADDISVTSVTAGNSTVDNDGLTIAGGPKFTSNGIDAGNQIITGVADGTVASGSKDAVTGGQLYELKNLLDVEGVGIKYFHAKSTLSDSQALGTDSIAIGPATIVNSADALAAGQGALVDNDAEGAMALGKNATANQYAESALAIGEGATVGKDGALEADGAEAAIAVGRNATSNGASSIALGDGAQVASEKVSHAIAVGSAAQGNGNNATAVGHAASAGGNATAVGYQAAASGGNASAFGQDAQASGTNAVAMGKSARALAEDDVSIGTAAGDGTVENPNGSAGNEHSHIAIGNQAGQNITGSETTAIGYQAGNNSTGDYSVALGSQAGQNLDGNRNISIGYQANQQAALTSVDHAIAIGDETRAGKNSVALGGIADASKDYSIALGYDATVDNSGGIAIGRSAHAKDGGTVALGTNSVAQKSTGESYLTGLNASQSGLPVVSVGSTSTKRRITNVADGSADTDAVNVNQLRQQQQDVADLIGSNASIDADGHLVYSRSKQGGVGNYTSIDEYLDTIANGTSTPPPTGAVMYNNDHSVVDLDGPTGNSGAGTRITNVADAISDKDAVNWGQLKAEIDDSQVHFASINSDDTHGNFDSTSAAGDQSIAIGPDANTANNADQSLAIGYTAQTTEKNATAVGSLVEARGENSTVLGYDSIAYEKSGIAIGDHAESNGVNSIVAGTDAKAGSHASSTTVNDAVVIGTNAEVSADNGVAVGEHAVASAKKAMAYGYDADASGESAVATGTEANAIGTNAYATGTSANASGADAHATGTAAHASGTNAYASGKGAHASGENAFASGTDSRGYATDAVAMGTGAVSGLQNPATPEEQADNRNTIAIGTQSLANAKNASALGNQAKATAESALAAGDHAYANMNNAMAMGSGGSDANTWTQATAAGALALGGNATAGAKAAGEDAIAIGGESVSSATASLAVGHQAKADRDYAVALGDNAQANNENDVALGAGSVTATTGQNTGTFTMGDENAAGLTSGAAVVSVGSADHERQIQNVAPGVISDQSTDAINGSQLYATNTYLSNVATTSKEILGGNAALGSDGKLSTSDIGGTGKDTVHDAIEYAAQGWTATDSNANDAHVKPGGKVKFDGDNNISVAQTGDDTLGKIAVSLNDDLTIGGDNTDGQITIKDGDDNDRIALNGKDGTIGLTNGSGKDTTIGYNDTGSPLLDGTGEGRLTYTDEDNKTQQVATLNDGLHFTGNDTSDVIDKKLNETLTIKGGLAAGEDASDANIRVDNDNGDLDIKLAKNLTDLDSVAVGDTYIDNSGITFNKGASNSVSIGGDTDGNLVLNAGDTNNPAQIKNLAAGTDPTDAVNVSQLQQTSFDAGQNGPVVYTDTDGNKVAQAGDGKWYDASNVNPDGSVNTGATPVAGTDVIASVQAADGSTTGAKMQLSNVADGEVSSTSTDAVNGSQLFATNQNVATNTTNISDLQTTVAKPITFSGNDNTTGPVTAKLGDTVAITGEATTTGTYSGANLKTVTDASTGKVSIQMADNPEFTSVKTGNTTMDTNGLVVEDGSKKTVVDADYIAVTGTKSTIRIDGSTGTIDGLTNTTWDPNNVTSDQAASEGQLQDLNDLIGKVSDDAYKGWNVGVNGESGAEVKSEDNVDFSNNDGNITIAKTDNDNDHSLTFDLADNLKLGKEESSSGAGDGVDGSLAVNGQDGKSGVGLNGEDGSIDMSNGDGDTINIHLVQGAPNLDDADPNDSSATSPRIEYTDGAGNKQQIATLNDGLTFTGDNNESVDRKLGTELKLNGGAADTSDNNIAVKKNGDGFDIKLAENVDVGANGSFTAGGTQINNNGLVFVDGSGAVQTNAPSITTGGIDMGVDGSGEPVNKITNLAAGTDDTDAVNVSQLRQTSFDAGQNGPVVYTDTDGNKVAQAGDGKWYDAADVNPDGSTTTGATEVTGDVIASMQSAGGSTTDPTTLANVAAGEAKTDAVNVSQLGNALGGDSFDADGNYVGPTYTVLGKDYDNVGDAIDASTTHYYSVNDGGTVGGNYNNHGATADNALAAGVNAEANGKDSIAIGQGAKANISTNPNETGGIAIGGEVMFNPEKPGQSAKAIGSDSIAIGSGAIADAGSPAQQGALAVGKQAHAIGDTSVALGSDAYANMGTAVGHGARAETGGVALGGGANTGPGVEVIPDMFYLNNNVALGDNTTITSGQWNVALGSGSVASDDNLSHAAYNPGTGTLAGTTPQGEVSLGYASTTDPAAPAQFNRRITNLAAGADDTDAVNVSQLKAMAESDKGGGFGLAAEGAGNEFSQDLGTTTQIIGDDNINTSIVDGTDGHDQALQVALGNDINIGHETVGNPGDPNYEEGEDGSLAVNGKDGSGIGLNGADGSIDMSNGNGDTINIHLVQGAPNLDDADPNDSSVTSPRIEYTDGDGNKQQVATLNDGLTFTGDNNESVDRKLGTELKLNGGATDSSDNNIAVERNADDDGFDIKLAENVDVGASGSFTAGGTQISSDGLTFVDTNGDQIADTPSIAENGIDGGDQQITGVTSGLGSTDLADATGDTLTNAANIGDLQKLSSAESGGGFGLTADQGDSEVTQDLGKTIALNGDGNIVTTADDTGKAIAIGLGNDITIGEQESSSGAGDGVDGSLAVNGQDGKSGVGLNGEDGSIDMSNGDGDTINIHLVQGAPNLDDADPNDSSATSPRIEYTDGDGNKQQIATLNDGLIFGANAGDDYKAKLGERVAIVGASGNTDWNEFDAGQNIMTQVNGNGQITIGLAKDVVLDGGSVSFGDSSSTKLSGDGLDNGGNQITNVGSGMTNAAGDTVTDLNDAVASNGANMGDLQDLASGDKGGGFGLADQAGGSFTQDLGTTATIVGDGDKSADFAGGNIATEVVQDKDGNDVLQVGLADDINVDSVTAGDETGQHSTMDKNGVTVADGDGNSSELTTGGLDVADTDGNKGHYGADGATIEDDQGNKTTVGAGDVTLSGGPNDDVVLGNDGLDNGNNQITNVASGMTDEDGNSVDLADAVDTNGANIGDLQDAVGSVTDADQGGGFGLSDGHGGSFKQDLGTTAEIVGDGNITTDVVGNDDEGYALQVGLGNDINIGQSDADSSDGQSGTDGHIGVAGKDGSSVDLNGEDGTVAFNNGSDGSSAKLGVEKGPAGIDGTDGYGNEGEMDRLTYDDANGNSHTVATMDDGLTFAGDSGTDVSRKLGQTVKIQGGETDPDKLTTGNIGVVADGSDTLQVQLAKDLDLGDDGSVTTGNTTMNNDGLAVGDGDGNRTVVTTGGTTVTNSSGASTSYRADGMTIEGGPSVTADGIDGGGERITNVAPGVENDDVATVGQLRGNQAYTDRRVNALRNDVHELGNRLDAGVASAMAAAALPQAYRPGQSSAAVAMGEFHGEGGLAIGLSTITDNGRYIFKLNGTTNTRGDAGVGVGAAVVW